MTPRDYLISIGLAKPGRGRFSREGVKALEQARERGMTFDEPAKPVPVKVVTRKPDAVTTEAAAPASPGEAANVDPAAVRAWAKDEGHIVADRGRIPATVINAYLAAKGGEAVRRRDPGAVIQEAPRAFPEGTRFRFSNKETGRTYTVDDRVACHVGGVSLSHCHGSHQHTALVNGTDGIVPVEPV